MIHTREQKRKVTEAAMRRRPGMSPEAESRFEEFKESCDDWSGTCGTCGAHLSGTLKQLRAHQHDTPEAV